MSTLGWVHLTFGIVGGYPIGRNLPGSVGGVPARFRRAAGTG